MTKLKTILSGATLFAAALTVPVSGDEIATTVDGKKVMLYDNGTWQYITKRRTTETRPDQAAVAPVRIDTTGLVKIMLRQEGADMRGLNWGIDQAQLKQRESAEFLGGANDTLRYLDKTAGFDTRIDYVFEKGTLKEGIFVITRKPMDHNDYNREYINLRMYLESLYGATLHDHNNFKNPMYRDKPAMWGFAVSIGFLERRTIWQRGNTKTSVFVTGGSHSIETRISMRSVDAASAPVRQTVNPSLQPPDAKTPADTTAGQQP